MDLILEVYPATYIQSQSSYIKGEEQLQTGYNHDYNWNLLFYS